MTDITAPRCIAIECNKPVKPYRSSRTPILGHRVIDDVKWCWFCCRECGGRAAGRRAQRNGQVSKYARLAREAKLRSEQAARMALLDEDIKALAYYGAPRHLVAAILERVFKLGSRSGYDKCKRDHPVRAEAA